MRKAQLTRVALLCGVLSGVGWAGDVGAAPAELEASAPAGRGQKALTLRVTGDGKVQTGVCAAAPCPTTGAVIDVSADLDVGAPMPEPRVEIVDVGQGRRIAHLRWGDAPAYHLVIAAPPPGSSAAQVVHRGWSDRFTGVEGERSASHVELTRGREPRQLVVGELREDVSLCGRPALLAPLVLDPTTLTLKPARLQRLPARERRGAPTVVAQVVEDATPGALTLQAVAASSAVGRPGHASDGDLETTWAEGGGGAGRGEFVTLRAPKDVTIRAFELVSRPPSGGVAAGAGPRVFWLASDEAAVRVEVPEDPWATPGARLRVELPEPWRTGCVAWVAEEAYGEGVELQVTIAEFVALPDGGDATPEELVEWIVEDGDRVAQAVALLAGRVGLAGNVVRAALPNAPPRARRHLLDVVDRLPCDESSPSYATALAVGNPELVSRASRALRRCSTEAIPALRSALSDATASAETRVAQELALLAPSAAVEVLVPRLDVESAARRLGLRQAIAQAAKDPAASAALRAQLVDGGLSERARVDLLRALGHRVLAFPTEASAALQRVLGGGSFRARYLALGPAVHLAPKDPRAAAFVAEALTGDAEPAVRAEAAAKLGAILSGRSAGAHRPRAEGSGAPFEAELLRAVSDENVRVRDAAARALGQLGSGRAESALLHLLDRDDWPLARKGAAESLGFLPASASVDGALGDALREDESPVVRAAAARALGRRPTPAAGEWLLRALRDGEEAADVRQEAARSLGQICATGARAALLEQALRLSDPHIEPEQRRLSVASLRALGELRSPGLREQLAPLLGDGVPRQVRKLAAEAADPSHPGCRAVSAPAGRR